MNRSERFLLFLLWWTLFRRLLTRLDRGFANLSGPERKKE